MKTSIIILVILAVLVLLFIGHLTISFKPFCISLPYWHRALGIVLFVISMMVYSSGERLAGYNDGFKDGMDEVIKLLDKKVKDINANSRISNE